LEKDIESEEIKEKITKININELSYEYIDTQAINYFGKNKEKYEIFKKLMEENENIKQIVKNPLILIMVFSLIYCDQIIDFKSLFGLYDRISDMRLLSENEKNQVSRKIIVKENNKEENEQEIHDIMEKRKDFLSELAYISFSESVKIDVNTYKEIKRKYI
jgi:hypothetical protein